MTFERIDITSPADVPASEAGVVDVAVLDMNAGMANLGCASIVDTVRELAAELGVRARAVVFDVRRTGLLPDIERFALVLGTGGPGHIDPRENDGVKDWSMGIVDDPSWEPRLFALFDAIRAREDRALFAVCHTYGLLCHWSGIARAGLRPSGRRKGVVTALVNAEGRAHPFFSALVPADGVLTVLESRQFNLVRTDASLPAGMTILGAEDAADGSPMLMVEFARAADGRPRMFGVNFHPEVGGMERQRRIFADMVARGALTQAEAEDKLQSLADIETHAAAIMRTYEAVFAAPVRAWMRDLTR